MISVGGKEPIAALTNSHINQGVKKMNQVTLRVGTPLIQEIQAAEYVAVDAATGSVIRIFTNMGAACEFGQLHTTGYTSLRVLRPSEINFEHPLDYAQEDK